MTTPICQTCMDVHGRDTNAPIQCGVCKKIVGCLWHNRALAHIRACERSRWPALALAAWHAEHGEDSELGDG